LQPENYMLPRALTAVGENENSVSDVQQNTDMLYKGHNEILGC